MTPRTSSSRPHTDAKGHSFHKVCLVTAIDRESDTLIRVSNLGVPAAGDLSDTLHATMPAGTTLCTDQASGYVALVKQESVNLVQLRGGRIKHGLYHIKRQPTSHLAQNVSSSFPRSGDKVSAELHDVVADQGFP